MSKIYLRLKHFVAAWARHNYGGGPDDPGRELRIEQMTDAVKVLQMAQFNVNDKVIPQCFCERQWTRMMRGEHIGGDGQNFMVEVRDPDIFLTEAEVCRLAGVEPIRGESMGEYVCIGLPDEIARHNQPPVRTNSQWQLMHDAAIRLADIIDNAFNDAMFAYIDRSVHDAQLMSMERYTSDALEAFMSINDIRNCADDREKRCLWRRYYRYLERNARDSENAQIDEDFYTGKERRREVFRTFTSKRPVLCVETNETYGSMTQAASQLGLGYSAIRMAIKRGTKCGGRTFVEV